jgi:hypothetical protein
MSAGNIKNRLQLADETIAILRSSNSQLDRNLAVLQSDFSVMESLLIESGQTLQRLQEMVRFAWKELIECRAIRSFIACSHFMSVICYFRRI